MGSFDLFRLKEVEGQDKIYDFLRHNIIAVVCQGNGAHFSTLIQIRRKITTNKSYMQIFFRFF